VPKAKTKWNVFRSRQERVFAGWKGEGLGKSGDER